MRKIVNLFWISLEIDLFGHFDLSLKFTFNIIIFLFWWNKKYFWINILKFYKLFSLILYADSCFIWSLGTLGDFIDILCIAWMLYEEHWFCLYSPLGCVLTVYDNMNQIAFDITNLAL